MSGSGVPCRAQDGGLQQLLDRIQTVRIRRRISDLDFAAFDGKCFRFSGGIADSVHRPPDVKIGTTIFSKKAKKNKPYKVSHWVKTIGKPYAAYSYLF